ncbi:hypothetical protein [Streptomyces griseomycini]|uniref:Uncharacterized protein n=1 Tax=Streptomyces griseomycini TaxID=66895 RepID=A0A7W7LZU3_9ACTN|nr:hypothetical protein [Streptomyces griseomycini]MBB4898738.1 hypothetical protein [Streptomyces griseomycini]GGQ03603.1 hypothetical protein GCM10010266_28850 [Streptomyces griseomycini]GGR18954.1 hypothetical protein GCM10015536_25750 [Streptomyces griseomycini]
MAEETAAPEAAVEGEPRLPDPEVRRSPDRVADLLRPASAPLRRGVTRRRPPWAGYERGPAPGVPVVAPSSVPQR